MVLSGVGAEVVESLSFRRSLRLQTHSLTVIKKRIGFIVAVSKAFAPCRTFHKLTPPTHVQYLPIVPTY
jgi:hypothetical protein